VSLLCETGQYAGCVDNLTHSLAGLIMGDAALALRTRFGSSASPRYRAAALSVAALASNAPDFDFLYVGITGGRLGYLLHHRGHTHTLAVVLPLGLLAALLVALGFRLAKPHLGRSDLLHLGVLGVLGGVLHVLMDFGNNYGVHPFWPLYDGWFYGDAIFIIDPWLLIILTGMALGLGASRVLRGALLLGLLALLALVWGSQLAGAGLASLLTAFAGLWVAALWRASFRTRWLAGGGALLALWLVLLGTRQVARASVRAALERASAPGFTLAELVSTPAPGNPLCWSVIAVQVSDEEYVVRQALASGWPALSSPTQCRATNSGQTAPVVRPSLPAASVGDRVVWGPEFRAPRAELTRARDESCVARAYLRFARVPFWIEEGGHATLIGDLRFDRSTAIEFAELLLPPDAPCPRHVPPWLPPLSWTR
jgi:inner membrane protein